MNEISLKQAERVPMQRLSLSWIVERLTELRTLAEVKSGASGPKIWFTLMNAKEALNSLTAASIYSSHIRISRNKAADLAATLDDVLNKISDIHNFEISDFDIWKVGNQREQLETVLMSELAVLPIYLVSAKDAFDLEKIIDSGSNLFPPSMLLKVPETGKDALESGRSLAFELDTACGFHTFRVLEAVVRRYWDVVSLGKTRPEPQTLGTMAGHLEKCNLGDVKVIESLKQMTKLHRNPISHPDVTLSSDEAVAILGMARSVITPMLLSLPDALPTIGQVPALTTLTP